MKPDKSRQRVRTMFGEISRRYDFLNHFLSAGTDYYWRWRAVRKVPLRGEAPILDVCTGTGDLALAFWKRAPTSARIVGTDFTRQMLTIADGKTRSLKRTPNGSPPVFLEADTLHMPFSDDCFQIVSVSFGLRNLCDTGAGLREMIRVCQPGGHVLVLEFSLPGNRLLRGLYLWYFKHILPRIGQFLARNQHAAYSYLPETVSGFPFGQELADVMQQHGLESVDWTPLTCGIATLYCGRKPINNGASKILETAPAEIVR